mgnify:CR=1 FL=1
MLESFDGLSGDGEVREGGHCNMGKSLDPKPASLLIIRITKY